MSNSKCKYGIKQLIYDTDGSLLDNESTLTQKLVDDTLVCDLKN